MHRIETPLPGVYLIEPRVFADDRGFFMETYHEDKFAELGIEARFVQDNHSRSGCGTLRGLHYQLLQPQAKLCRVVAGSVLDVVVDIRYGSPTFGHSFTALLTAENKRMIYVPRGFAHGFVVCSEAAEFLYKCDDFYRPDDERGVAWNDPDLGVDWGIAEPLLSGKDRQNPRLAALQPDDLPTYVK